MKVFWLCMALVCSSPALAGGAIGGSTGSKCREHIILNRVEFQRLVQTALSQGELIVQGENMRVESLDLDEQVLQMRSLDDDDFSIIWIIEVRDWD
ncbi:MAG: hypothetical protein M3Q07_00395 [Pseudobdellovibrionaceae bacterium]|nr:hypothetical protein [Pseudobdellovibrionaceae bacterium]